MPKTGKSGKGTHGSLSKAGKLRTQNPKQWKSQKKAKSGYTKWNYKRGKSPRLVNRRKYEKREILKRKIGQNRIDEK